jgi:hypothetical protein
MSDPFSDLATAVAGALGTDTTVAGFILGSVVVVALVIALQWAIAGKPGKGGDTIFLISAGIGVVISTLVGWYPIWAPIFIVVIVVFIMVGPFARHAGGT